MKIQSLCSAVIISLWPLCSALAQEALPLPICGTTLGACKEGKAIDITNATGTVTWSCGVRGGATTKCLLPSAAIPAPKKGAFFGAWVNPENISGLYHDPAEEEKITETVESKIGRNLALHMHYYPWHGAADNTTPSFPDQAMADDANPPNGTVPRIPVVTWACGNTNLNVANGEADQLIINTAQAVRNYGKPIFIRWYWEMNLAPGANDQSCMGSGGPAGYIQAWQHIYNIFKSEKVTNVAWLWNPAAGPGTITNRDPMPYYPGSSFVDWIGFDGYDVAGTGDFGAVFAPFYDEFKGMDKPMLVAETGALNSAKKPSLQAAYLASASAEIEGRSANNIYAFPWVKGFMYFDKTGSAGNWVFNPEGLAAFRIMGEDPFFNPAEDPGSINPF